MKKYTFNAYKSNQIPLRRPLPDYRSSDCRAVSYPPRLPTASVVICFINEMWSAILRTVWSVLDRTPAGLLNEIILVDDNSEADWLGKVCFVLCVVWCGVVWCIVLCIMLYCVVVWCVVLWCGVVCPPLVSFSLTSLFLFVSHFSFSFCLSLLFFFLSHSLTLFKCEQDFEAYIARMPSIVKLVRSSSRLGLIRARMLGAKQATGDVLIFLDAHCEATTGVYLLFFFEDYYHYNYF